MNTKVAKAVAEEGGISLLASLARSKNKIVAEEAAGGLWNLSVGEEHKVLLSVSYPSLNYLIIYTVCFGTYYKPDPICVQLVDLVVETIPSAFMACM